MLTRAQTVAHSQWLSDLASLGFEPVSLERENYAPIPWHQLRDAIGEADGVLVLGFRQMSVEVGRWRPDTEEAASAAGWYATPWNQLEAGLAIAAGLPVLVAAEPGIVEGVFAADVWTGSVYGVAVDDLAGGLSTASNMIGEVLDAWAEAVNKRASARVERD